MLKINFNSPIPYSQRDRIIRELKNLGLSYERIHQNGTYSLHRFYGRLPTISADDIDDVEIHFIDDKTRENFMAHGSNNSVEIFLKIERKTS